MFVLLIFAHRLKLSLQKGSSLCLPVVLHYDSDVSSNTLEGNIKFNILVFKQLVILIARLNTLFFLWVSGLLDIFVFSTGY